MYLRRLRCERIFIPDFDQCSDCIMNYALTCQNLLVCYRSIPIPQSFRERGRIPWAGRGLEVLQEPKNQATNLVAPDYCADRLRALDGDLSAGAHEAR